MPAEMGPAMPLEPGWGLYHSCRCSLLLTLCLLALWQLHRAFGITVMPIIMLQPANLLLL